MKNERIYLSTKLYESNLFKNYNPQMELTGLRYLLERQIEQEKYEVAGIITKRIRRIKWQLSRPAGYVWETLNYSLN